MSGQTNTCEGCGKLLAPLETYGRYPVNLCFGCWIEQGLAHRNRQTDAAEEECAYNIMLADASLRNLRDKAETAQYALDAANYEIRKAKARLDRLLSHPKPDGGIMALSTS